MNATAGMWRARFHDPPPFRDRRPPPEPAGAAVKTSWMDAVQTAIGADLGIGLALHNTMLGEPNGLAQWLEFAASPRRTRAQFLGCQLVSTAALCGDLAPWRRRPMFLFSRWLILAEYTARYCLPPHDPSHG